MSHACTLYSKGLHAAYGTLQILHLKGKVDGVNAKEPECSIVHQGTHAVCYGVSQNTIKGGVPTQHTCFALSSRSHLKFRSISGDTRLQFSGNRDYLAKYSADF